MNILSAMMVCHNLKSKCAEQLCCKQPLDWNKPSLFVCLPQEFCLSNRKLSDTGCMFPSSARTLTPLILAVNTSSTCSPGSLPCHIPTPDAANPMCFPLDIGQQQFAPEQWPRDCFSQNKLHEGSSISPCPPRRTDSHESSSMSLGPPQED